MPLTLGIAGAGAGLVSGIYGGVKAGQERKKMQSYLDGQKADNEAWYNENYHSNYMDRADTQAMLKNMRDNLNRTNKAAENTAVVTGATPEAVSLVKENANKVITDTYSRTAALGQNFKDRISGQYLNMKSNLANQQMNMMEGNAQSYENLMGNGLGGMTSGMTSIATSLIKS